MIFHEQQIVAVTCMGGQKMPLFVFKPFEVNDISVFIFADFSHAIKMAFHYWPYSYSFLYDLTGA